MLELLLLFSPNGTSGPCGLNTAYFLIVCTPRMGDPGFHKVGVPTPDRGVPTYYFANYFWVTTSRSETKQSNLRNLFRDLFGEAFLQATRVVVVFIKSWKSPFAISFIEC